MAIAQWSKPNSYFRRLSLLKKLLWLYFLLLIFEGALRKWVAPQLSGPLLVVRDPVALMIIWEAYRSKKWPTRWSIALVVITVLMVGLYVLQSIAGDNPLAGLYGLHSYLLPFPVMFIMGESLDAEDLRVFGNWILGLLLLQAGLAAAQYVSPAGSFINNGAYEGASQISYIAGTSVRASGTFSFVIGLAEFGTLAAGFLFYGLGTEGFARKWLLWLGILAFLFMLPMTGSRTLVVQAAAVLGCVGISAMMGAAQFGRVLRILVPIVILAVLVSFLPVFSDAMHTLTERFAEASSVEGGSVEQSIFERTAEPAVQALERASDSNNWLGIGIGRGAVAVQAFLNGSIVSEAGEDEFSHEYVEMGPIGASLYEIFKLILAFVVLAHALSRARDQEPLALLLAPLAVSGLLLFVPEQPTEQGFIVVSMAFCIAAAKMPRQAAQPAMPLILERRQMLYHRRVRRRTEPGSRF